jgi:hypothetical protein
VDGTQQMALDPKQIAHDAVDRKESDLRHDGAVGGLIAAKLIGDESPWLRALTLQHTEASMRVSAELRIAREERTPYFLLWGWRDIMCTQPIGAKPAEGMYSWTRQTLQDQITLALRKARADATTETVHDATRKG